MNRRLLVLAALWAAVTAAVAIVPGCYGRVCEGSTATFGRGPNEGRMIDEDTWESAPMDGKWLFYPGARLWVFDVPALGERKPIHIFPYISPIEEPNVFGPDKPVNNFTLAGGNLAELSGVNVNRFAVRNGSCADYFLRVVVELEPRPPQPPNAADPDSGASVAPDVDGGADASDAGSDADTDAEAGP